MVIDSAEFDRMFQKKCVGKKGCELEIDDILKGDLK